MIDRVSEPDLDWLNAALFTSGGFLAASDGRFAALRSAGDLQRIIPRDRRAAVAAFAKTHDGMSRARLLAGRATQAGIAAGLGRVAFRDGLTLAPELGLDGDPERSLLARLSQTVRASSVAITLGPKRHNRKPVIQLMRDGTTVAYAKVACDDVTQQLVASEAPWFGRSGDARGALAIPALLDVFDWNGKTVAVMAAAGVVEHNPDALDTQRIASLTRDIARLGDRRTRAVPELVEQRFGEASPGLRATATAVAERFENDYLEVGAWHGDLTPWNTISENKRTWVLDWEFADDAVPVGADAFHHQVMVATHLRGRSNADALRETERSAAETLVEVGSISSAPAAWAVYLLELAWRDERLRAAGVTPTGLGDAAHEALTDSLAAPEAFAAADAAAGASDQPATGRTVSETASARGGLLNGAASILGTGLAFLMTFVIANHYGASLTGVFFGAVSAFIIVATAMKLGAETALVLFISRLDSEGRLGDARQALRIALGPVLIGSVLAGIAIWFSANALADLFTDDIYVDQFSSVLRVFALFVPAWALSLCLLGATRGAGTMAPTAYGLQVVQPVAQFGLTAAAVVSDASLTTLAWGWAAPIGLTMFGALAATLRLLPSGANPASPTPANAQPAMSRGEFWDYAVPRGIAGSLQMALERVGVLLVGALSTAAIAGQWAAISRLVGLAQRVFHAIGQALNPRISALAAAKDWSSVSSAVDRLTQWTMLILTPALLALATFPEAALGLFGDDFQSGASALRIAALVVLGASLLAHADNVLLMSGESRLAMRNTGAALVVAVIGYLVLVPLWADVGAALAFAAGVFVYRLASTAQIRRRHVQPFGRQSVTATVVAALCFAPPLLIARVLQGDKLVTAIAAGLIGLVLYAPALFGLRRSGRIELALR
jgi:O-antigen/teichoic acid export membrane protein